MNAGADRTGSVRDGIAKMGPRFSMDIIKVPPDVTMFQNMETYIYTRLKCLYAYNQQPNMSGELLRETSEFLKKNQPQNSYQWEAMCWDPEFRIDFAMRYGFFFVFLLYPVDSVSFVNWACTRYMSGCPSRKSWDGALTVLESFTDPKNEAYRRCDDKQTMDKVLACMALAYYEKYHYPRHRLSEMTAEEVEFGRPKPPFASPFAYLYLAAQYADAAARRGFVPSAVLMIGFYIQRLGDAMNVDATKMPLFEEFTDLWRVCLDRATEVFAEERQRLAKAKKMPNAYTCAAEECGIKAVKAAAFSACSGPCPADIKPRYCSRACQVKVCATSERL